MRYGSHCCFVSEDAGITRLAVASYIRDGLAARDRVMCVLGQGNHYWLAQALASARTAVDERLTDGSLVIVDLSGTPTWQGAFSPVDTARLMFDAITTAQRDGYAGLRVCSDMAWGPHHRVPHHALVELERLIETGLRARAGMGLCLYDPRRFSSAQIAERADHHGVRAGPGSQREPCLQILHTPYGLRLIGEADFTVRHLLDAALREASARTGADLVVDLTSLAFADVSALDALFDAATRLPAHRRLLVRSPTPTMRKVMTALGWDTVAAIRHQPRRDPGVDR